MTGVRFFGKVLNNVYNAVKSFISNFQQTFCRNSKGISTLKVSESQINPLFNYAICSKLDQNRMENKKATYVCKLDN